MSQQSRKPIVIADADQTAINTALNTLTGVLSKYSLTLTADERKSLPKFGDKSTAFVQKAEEFIATHPEFLPSYVSAGQFNENLSAFSVLTTIERTLNELTIGVDNSRLVSGSEAYNTALIYYDSVKKAAAQKIPAAQMLADELAIRFQQRAKAQPDS